MSYHSLLNEKSQNLTPSQKRLLNYILSNDDESVFLKIQDLAPRANVSVATVVRLAKALGYDGFPEFQQELRRLFRDKLTTVSRLRKAAQNEADEENVMAKVLQQDVENISETLRQVSIEDFKKFVDTLNSAERTVIIGLRSAHALAVLMGVALEFLQRDVWIVTPGIGDMWDRLLALKKEDVVVGISFPRYTRETVRAVQFAKSRLLRTLAITDSLTSPLARYADVVLTARCRMDSFVESFTAPLSLINAIVTAIGVSCKESTVSALRQFENFWETQKIYFDEEASTARKRK
ncbi:MAG: MurR/RpiR family transcriptional regulator [Thermodesulfobacteriota bacterium]